MKEKVILVDKDDNPTGEMEKMEAHESGLLHRAFSVFTFNSKGELLLQKRALHKYHSGGKWTNTCCSHPRPGEKTQDAANRRLKEEMNLACELSYGFGFVYKSEFENGLVEHEYDHVYFGVSDAIPHPDPKEVESWRYATLDDIVNDIDKQPDQYTSWLKICINQVKAFKQINK